MRYQLRPVEERDREWLYELKTDAYHEVVELQFGSWEEPLQRQIFDDRWEPEISSIVVVNGADVGLLAVEKRENEFFLNEIQLVDGARGRGLGSQIIGDLLREARAQGKPVKLQVLRRNSRARRLYERLGFSETGATDTHYVMLAV